MRGASGDSDRVSDLQRLIHAEEPPRPKIALFHSRAELWRLNSPWPSRRRREARGSAAWAFEPQASRLVGGRVSVTWSRMGGLVAVPWEFVASSTTFLPERARHSPAPTRDW